MQNEVVDLGDQIHVMKVVYRLDSLEGRPGNEKTRVCARILLKSSSRDASSLFTSSAHTEVAPRECCTSRVFSVRNA